MDYLTQRFEMIAERILENERLTADLDDEAAQVLLDWGLSSAKLIVDSTVGIEDEEEADEVMYTRLRANSRLMRTVNKWVPTRQTMSKSASLQEFGKVGQYVETVYAETFIAPRKAEWQAFLSSYQANNDVEMIVNLRNLFESAERSVPSDELDEGENEVLHEDLTDKTPSEQVPSQEPTPIAEPATDETSSEQVPSQVPTPIAEPATDEPQTKKEPIDFNKKDSVRSDDFSRSGPPKTTEVVTTDETPSPQAPTRDQSSSINPNLQDSKPKSFPKRLWNWATSFFRRR